MNRPKSAKTNGHGGYTVFFENGSKIEHVIAFDSEHAFEMVKCTPEYPHISKQKGTNELSAKEIDEMENRSHMRGCRGVDF